MIHSIITRLYVCDYRTFTVYVILDMLFTFQWTVGELVSAAEEVCTVLRNRMESHAELVRK